MSDLNDLIELAMAKADLRNTKSSDLNVEFFESMTTLETRIKEKKR